MSGESRQNAWDVSSIEDIFFVPVSSVIKADFYAARQFLEYVESFGFSAQQESDPERVGREGFIGDLRMTSFRFQESSGNGPARDRYLRVPALSMIPLPLLQVQEADFDFAVRVVQADRDRRPEQLTLEGDEGGASEPELVDWKAMLVAEQPGGGGGDGSDAASHIDANIKVHLKVRQSDMPAGISRLLAVMNDNTQIVSPYIDINPGSVWLRPGESKSLVLSAHDFDGDVAAGVPVQLTQAAGDKLRVMDEVGEWRVGDTRETASDGRIHVELNWSSKPPVDPVTIGFAGLLEGSRIEGTAEVVPQNLSV